MALLVCAVWKQVVKNNVFVSQLPANLHFSPPDSPPHVMSSRHTCSLMWQDAADAD